MPQTTEKEPELDLYAGGVPDDDLDGEASGDRGDSLEPVAAQETPVDEPQAAEPVADEPQEAEAPAPEPAKEAAEAEKEPADTEHGDQRIPKSRFDQVNERRKLAEQRLRELEQQMEAQKKATQAPGSFDFDAAEQQYMEAVVDGEFDKAKAIRGEIRAAERAALQAEHDVLRERASQETIGRLEFENTVKDLLTDYPFYNPEGEGYDEVLTSEALEIHQGLLSTGRYSAAQAIRKAAEMVAKANGLTPAGQQQAAPAPVTPARDTKPDITKKVAAAKAQPPKQVVGTKGDSTPAVHEMSEDEFASLPESTLRKLRGDLV